MIKIYKINRGIGQALEFQGLKAPYFARFAALSMGILTVWGVLHVTGVPFLLAVLLALVPGGFGLRRLYRMSSIYGEHGLMKKSARRDLPSALVSRSRQVFIKIAKDGNDSKF